MVFFLQNHQLLVLGFGVAEANCILSVIHGPSLWDYTSLLGLIKFGQHCRHQFLKEALVVTMRFHIIVVPLPPNYPVQERHCSLHLDPRMKKTHPQIRVQASGSQHVMWEINLCFISHWHLGVICYNSKTYQKLTVTGAHQVKLSSRVIFICSNTFLHVIFFKVKVLLWPARKWNSLKQDTYQHLANFLEALALTSILTTLPLSEKTLTYGKSLSPLSRRGP